MEISELHREMYRVVRSIPSGKVLTYGQVAELAGVPGASRAAGAAMRAVTPEMGVPWHRVVGKGSRGRGKIAILDPIGSAAQQELLEREGVVVNDKFIDLTRHGWTSP